MTLPLITLVLLAPTVDARLDELIDRELVQIDHGPAALDVHLPRGADEDRYWSVADQAFLKTHAGKVRPRMRAALKADGSARAAFVLGLLGDREALPELRKRFLETREFYSWESSLPDVLSAQQYPRHHAYEQAVVAITGAERAALAKRARAGDYAALYVLHRDAPQAIAPLIFEVRRRLGPPDLMGERWIWRLKGWGRDYRVAVPVTKGRTSGAPKLIPAED